MAKKKQKQKLNIRLIWKHYKPAVLPVTGLIVLVFVMELISTLLITIGQPRVIEEIINQVSTSIPNGFVSQEIFLLLLLLAGIWAVHAIVAPIRDFTFVRSIADIYENASNYAFKKLTVLSQRFFSNNFGGSLVAKMGRYVWSFNDIYGHFAFTYWKSAIRLIAVFIVIFMGHPTMGYFFLAWILVFMTFNIVLVRLKIPFDLEASARSSKVTGFVADVITNIMTTKIFSRLPSEHKRFSKSVHDERLMRHRSWRMDSWRSFVLRILSFAFVIGSMTISVVLWARGEIEVGFVVALQLYYNQITGNLWYFGEAINKTMQAFTRAQEMAEILEQVPDILDPEQPEKSRMKHGEIIFQDVDFKYADGQSVFNDFNLVIPAGQKIGLVGHSGSGKSTFTNLVMRFVDVANGALLIDGQDIRQVTQDDLRKAISYVPQDPILFHRTIKENIAYGRPRAKKAEIIAAAKKARAHDFIMELPKGYNTLVGERGVKLSGGQRQRIAIARVMLEDAPILILDEATSSLDSISESQIQEAFIEAMKNRTTIVIAHRLSTVAHLDRILVLDHGKVVEEGSHKKLLKQGGHYRELWEHQVQI